jgi:hypothetical protein
MMRRFIRGAIAVVAIATGVVVSNESAGAETVTVQGCPVPGVTAGCLVIQGADKQTYNITAAKPQPMSGDRVIQLTGTKTDKASMCMQGVVLDDIKWSYTEQKCPKP